MALDKVYDIALETPPAGSSLALQLELIGHDKDVLDVGCATGYMARYLQQQSCRVSGLEGSPAAAELANEVLDKVVVCDLDKHDLRQQLLAEFGAESFDVINFGDVLEHLREPVTVLKNLKPLLRTGGYVVVSLPNVAHGDIRLALLSGRFHYNPSGLLDDTHLRFFTAENIEILLDDAGLALKELRRTICPLFHTEIGVREADYPAAVVDPLREDIEAITYQFVFAGLPTEWAPTPAAAEPDVAQLVRERDELREELAGAVQIAQQAQAMALQLVEQLEVAHSEVALLRGHSDATV